MIYYQIRLEENNKITILDVIDSDIKPKDGAGTMFVNLDEMNKFDQKLVESEYLSGIEKLL
jgi:hypothetical protein|nr:MAG TPA: hypothetical protein [Caudoviricetes sp.]